MIWGLIMTECVTCKAAFAATCGSHRDILTCSEPCRVLRNNQTRLEWRQRNPTKDAESQARYRKRRWAQRRKENWEGAVAANAQERVQAEAAMKDAEGAGE